MLDLNEANFDNDFVEPWLDIQPGVSLYSTKIKFQQLNNGRKLIILKTAIDIGAIFTNKSD